jgi:hypothetical protein
MHAPFFGLFVNNILGKGAGSRQGHGWVSNNTPYRGVLRAYVIWFRVSSAAAAGVFMEGKAARAGGVSVSLDLTRPSRFVPPHTFSASHPSIHPSLLFPLHPPIHLILVVPAQESCRGLIFFFCPSLSRSSFSSCISLDRPAFLVRHHPVGSPDRPTDPFETRARRTPACLVVFAYRLAQSPRQQENL